MKTRNNHTIVLTRENLTIDGIAIPLITPGLPEFERSNRREELLLAIAAICAEEATTATPMLLPQPDPEFWHDHHSRTPTVGP
jgi:hypothetical protein